MEDLGPMEVPAMSLEMGLSATIQDQEGDRADQIDEPAQHPVERAVGMDAAVLGDIDQHTQRQTEYTGKYRGKTVM